MLAVWGYVETPVRYASAVKVLVELIWHVPQERPRRTDHGGDCPAEVVPACRRKL